MAEIVGFLISLVQFNETGELRPAFHYFISKKIEPFFTRILHGGLSRDKTTGRSGHLIKALMPPVTVLNEIRIDRDDIQCRQIGTGYPSS